MSFLLPAIAAATLAVAMSTASARPEDNMLEAYRWRSRVLVVVAADARDARLAEQLRMVSEARSGFGARDLVVVEGVARTAEARALRARFDIPQAAFAAILVGKDGGEKLKSAEPIPAGRLFETIDAMPMRQDEIRHRGR